MRVERLGGQHMVLRKINEGHIEDFDLFRGPEFDEMSLNVKESICC